MDISKLLNDIPTLFSDKSKIVSYDYEKIGSLIGSEIDHTEDIENLSLPGDKRDICVSYFRSIMMGYNHMFIEKKLSDIGRCSNICLPLLHRWRNDPRIDNLVIISDPNDAERICKEHVKKAPIFASFLHDSIISTTDNDKWKDQRGRMNMAFAPSMSLKKVFPISRDRARLCVKILRERSNNFTERVNMSDFFLHETQSQLQLSMFGFSNEFQDKTNKRIRNAFAGIDSDYAYQFAEEALKESEDAKGPLSKVVLSEDRDPKADIGNMLIFAFAGHDTTGHTLTWLLYELCKHPKYKLELIDEVDAYWLRHDEESYDTFKELPFMTRCLTEALRLWPALANGTYRELEHEETIAGIDGEPVQVPKGTYCQIINWTRHRDPELWGPDANDFHPHREFQDSEIWNHEGFGTYNVSSERFSPFTYGPRNCIGKNFSHMEMRLILLNVFKYFDFSFSYDQLVTAHHQKGLNLFTMGPQSIRNDELNGMYMVVHPRKSKL
jgi:cytochrome P450